MLPSSSCCVGCVAAPPAVPGQTCGNNASNMDFPMYRTSKFLGIRLYNQQNALSHKTAQLRGINNSLFNPSTVSLRLAHAKGNRRLVEALVGANGHPGALHLAKGLFFNC